MFQGCIRLYGTNTLFWDYFMGQKRVFWALGLHNSIKSYADGTMICLLIVNAHKDIFYSNAGAFSGHYCWKSRFWVDSRGQKGGFWAWNLLIMNCVPDKKKGRNKDVVQFNKIIDFLVNKNYRVQRCDLTDFKKLVVKTRW